MTMEKDQKTVRFKYVFAKDYNPTYANGVYGGRNSRGEIVINFFSERMPLPKKQVYTVEEIK